MMSKLLARCPRRAPCTPRVTQAGCPRTYADVPRHELSTRNKWSHSRFTAVRPTRAVREDWNLSPKVERGQLTVTIKSKDLGIARVPISGPWLRDNCACVECRNPDTAQRRINVFKNAKAGEVVRVTGNESGTEYQVTFADGHRSTIQKSLIEGCKADQTGRLRVGYPNKIEFWRADIASSPPSVQYEAMKQSTGMADLLASIRKFGFCFVDNMPATPEATQALLEQIGPIRNTHYGGFYDFTSDLSSKDTAYTSESLESHTDTTYFSEPIGLQALHLLSHTDGEGGLSSLVDGFGVADQLYEADRAAYACLSHIGVYAHASGNEGISIQPFRSFPVLEHAFDSTELVQVRWNNADRAGVRASLGPNMTRWYNSAGKFDAALNDPENVYWFQLKPGKMLIFDNWRVLHGRSAFTGKRRMCGGYINRDDFISKYRMTNYTKEQIAASTVTG